MKVSEKFPEKIFDRFMKMGRELVVAEGLYSDRNMSPGDI